MYSEVHFGPERKLIKLVVYRGDGLLQRRNSFGKPDLFTDTKECAELNNCSLLLLLLLF